MTIGRNAALPRELYAASLESPAALPGPDTGLSGNQAIPDSARPRAPASAGATTAAATQTTTQRRRMKARIPVPPMRVIVSPCTI